MKPSLRPCPAKDTSCSDFHNWKCGRLQVAVLNCAFLDEFFQKVFSGKKRRGQRERDSVERVKGVPREQCRQGGRTLDCSGHEKNASPTLVEGRKYCSESEKMGGTSSRETKQGTVRMPRAVLHWEKNDDAHRGLRFALLHLVPQAVLAGWRRTGAGGCGSTSRTNLRVTLWNAGCHKPSGRHMHHTIPSRCAIAAPDPKNQHSPTSELLWRTKTIQVHSISLRQISQFFIHDPAQQIDPESDCRLRGRLVQAHTTHTHTTFLFHLEGNTALCPDKLEHASTAGTPSEQPPSCRP